MAYRSLPIIIFLLASSVTFSAESVDVGPLLKNICQVGPKAEGHVAATKAWRELSKADAEQLPAILAGMDGANPLAVNWIRTAVESIAQRRIDSGGKLPLPALNEFLARTEHSPRARRLAYELILSQDSSAREHWIPRLMNDPSLELRREAIERALADAAKLLEQDDKLGAKQAYRRAFSASRDIDQIKDAAAKLGELGDHVDLPTHFGFVIRWKLIGPFDNTDKQGFDVPYPPEKEIELKAHYQGKGAEVSWRDHTTEDEYGMVDLNQALGKHMGAIGYAFAVFEAEEACDADVRLGCINGNKVWVNGQLLFANHVYHANTQIDQYTGKCRLNKGRNEILVKIAQNEQTDDWAQNWQFQLRVCDRIGTAILSQNRAAKKLALRRQAVRR